MGLAASQARFLALTARKSNNEYQAQQINQQRLNLADEQMDFTKKYSEKMSNRMLYYLYDGEVPNYINSTYQLTYWNIVNPMRYEDESGKEVSEKSGMGYKLVDAQGNYIVPNYPGENTVTRTGETIGEIIKKYNVTDAVKDNGTLYENLKTGKWKLVGRRPDEEEEGLIPIDQATFLAEMRTENPDNEADTNYWRYFNTNIPMVDGKYQELTFENLTTMKDLVIKIVDENNQIVVDKLPQDDMMLAYGQYHVDAKCIDNAYLEEKLRSGEWFIQKPTDPSSPLTDYETTPWQGIPNIYDAYNSEDDAATEAEYEEFMAKLQKQDKMLALRLKQLETEHQAIETELDSVSKVIEDNVTKSFKTFSA